eukprot:1339551-Amorphochlora_amoeboformis.AAC.1
MGEKREHKRERDSELDRISYHGTTGGREPDTLQSRTRVPIRSSGRPKTRERLSSYGVRDVGIGSTRVLRLRDKSRLQYVE